MLDIKELTMEHHKNAERQEFVRILMSGEIDERLYATYLYNQLQCYSVLEKYGHHNGLFRQTPGLERAEKIHYDYSKLWSDIGTPPEITESTKEYVEHIESIQDDAHKLYAHIYVRHMGDLRGGQMIKKKTPIDRPIVLRHTDSSGKQHHHLLAGNTRATAVGHGVEAHHIDV